MTYPWAARVVRWPDDAPLAGPGAEPRRRDQPEVILDPDDLLGAYGRRRFMAPRSLWVEGPWDDEPDEVHWKDTASGYPCFIWRNTMGTLNGYVGVAEGHPLYGMHYDSAEAHSALRVHGGLTFTGPLAGSFQSVELAPEDTGRWWLGFDCGHFGDVMPAMDALTGAVSCMDATLLELKEAEARVARLTRDERFRPTYKTIDDVRLMVEDLAAQVAHVATLPGSVAEILARLREGAGATGSTETERDAQ